MAEVKEDIMTKEHMRGQASRLSDAVDRSIAKWKLRINVLDRFYTRMGAAMLLYSSVYALIEILLRDDVPIHTMGLLLLNVALSLIVMIYRPDDFLECQLTMRQNNEVLSKDIDFFSMECQEQRPAEELKEALQDIRKKVNLLSYD